MNEVHVQHQITMPASLMHAIEAACNSDMSPIEKYEATVLICHGYGLWERQTSFDPTSYAIPESQWQQIGEQLLKAGEARGDVAAVNLMLSFMNQGPSGFKEEVDDIVEVDEAERDADLRDSALIARDDADKGR
jgi:hypothetical protein